MENCIDPVGSSIFHLPSSIFHLPSSIFHLPSSIFHLPSSIFHLPSSIFHLPSSIFRFPPWFVDDLLIVERLGAHQAWHSIAEQRHTPLQAVSQFAQASFDQRVYRPIRVMAAL